MEKQKVIDWRLRPPFGSFEGCSIFETARNSQLTDPNVPKSVTDFSMDELIKEMDEANIVAAMVPIRIENDNEDIGRIKEAYPGRFEGLAHIDPFDGLAALDEIDKYVTNGPAKGIILEPGQIFLRDSMRPDDKRLWPIYEKCQAEDIVITLTFGGFYGRSLEYYNPEAIDRVALAFPDLKIVLTHAGFPYITQTCWIAIHRPNIYLSPDFWILSTNPGYQDYVTAANNILKDQFVFGSCYPAGPGLKAAVENLQKVGIKDEVLPKFLYENAARLLKLDD